jgi:NAD(P)-dependent dehydrogenase (short-subunit alcohol dehydrogenase family)
MPTRKVALVTGAGSGIGRNAALHLADGGFALVCAGRRKEPIERTANEIQDKGGEAIAVAADVTDPQSVVALFAQAKVAFGRLDVLFNNAGIGGPPGLLEDMPLDGWRRSVDTNLTGVFLCTQESFKLMKSQSPRGGRIINNGSISAHAPRPNSVAYTATKHAVTGLTKSASLDGRKYDIAVGQIDIGNAASEMASRIKDGAMQPSGEIRPEAVMDLDNVGRAVAYMASLPLDANVLFMTVMATKMPFVGRG